MMGYASLNTVVEIVWLLKLKIEIKGGLQLYNETPSGATRAILRLKTVRPLFLIINGSVYKMIMIMRAPRLTLCTLDNISKFVGMC